MKKCIAFLLVVVSISAQAQWVTIPDTAFVHFLQDSFPTCMNGNQMDTACTAIVTKTKLKCINKPVRDLTGIQYFDVLQTLECYQDSVEIVPAIPPTVTRINLSKNPKLKSLPPLPPALEKLDLGYCDFDTCPPVPATLKELYVDLNNLTSLPALPPGLEKLHLDVNRVTALPAQLPVTLTELFCHDNRITSLPALPPGLKRMYCSYNQLTVIPTLPQTLEWFVCHGNQLTTVPALPPGITLFNMGLNQISVMPALPSNLTSLYFYSNPITVVPTLPPTIKIIVGSNTLISSIPDVPDSLAKLEVANCPNLHCLPDFQAIDYLIFDAQNIRCLPSYPKVWGSSTPPLSSVGLCSPFNLHGCQVLWNINGRVFNDVNGNCVRDYNETSIPDLKLGLYENGVLSQQNYSGAYGVYSFDVNLGTYTTTVDTTGIPFDIHCPANRIHTSALTSVDSLDYNMNFAMQCKPGFDVGAWSVATSFLFPADTSHVYIGAGDHAEFWKQHCNTAGLSGQLTITINGPATYLAPDSLARTPASISGNVITYNISDWSLVHSATDFGIIVRVDTFAQSGQQVCFTIALTPAAGDNNPGNNTLTHCFSVVNSFDPNDKQVSPIGNIDTTQEWLTYTVRFQNTGTAAAQHIYIADTLDTDLDESTFQLLSYSHQPLVQLDQNAVRFNFPNINLPDSTSDEPASHGYVQYKVELKQNLPLGTQIENTAAIYFDFNPPVITNTTVNTLAPGGCTPPLASVTPVANTICSGDSITLIASGGTTYAWSDNLGNSDAVTASPLVTTTYTVTVADANNCTASATATVGVKVTGSLIMTQSLCTGDSMFFNNGYAKTAGTYLDTVVTPFGCDSFVTLILEFTNVLNSSLPASICSGESYQFGGSTFTTQGFYYDTLATAAGCDSIVALHLTVHPLPQPVITQNNDTLSTGSFTSYLWLRDGNLVPYQSFQQMQLTQNGNYSVVVTDDNGCRDTSAVFAATGVGVEEMTNDDLGMTIYPNPNKGNFTLEFSDNKVREVIITDMFGKTMLRDAEVKDEKEFILDDAAAGVYFVRVVEGKKLRVMKMVVWD